MRTSHSINLWSAKATVNVNAADMIDFQRFAEPMSAWIWFDRPSSTVDETDLLWFGSVESIDTVDDYDFANSGIGRPVKITMRGAGRFLEDAIYTGNFENSSLATIAETVADSIVETVDADRLFPLYSRAVTTGGTLARKISTEYKAKSIASILKELQIIAGGGGRAIWGVEPKDDADQLGQIYLRFWTGHLYERQGSDELRSWDFDASQVIKFEANANATGIVNSCKVVGSERPGEPLATENEGLPEKVYHEATIESPDSIAKFGKRVKVEEDSSLTSNGQCAMVAAGIVKSSCSRTVTVFAECVANIDDVLVTNPPETTATHLNVIANCFARPGELVRFRLGDSIPIDWDDSTGIGADTRTFGEHVEVLPKTITCEMVGQDAPVRVKIKGEANASNTSDYMKSLVEQIQTTQENARTQ